MPKMSNTLSLKKDVAPAQKASVETVSVRTVSGRMVHLFTNAVFTVEPQLVELDDYVNSQVEAGKLLVVAD